MLSFVIQPSEELLLLWFCVSTIFIVSKKKKNNINEKTKRWRLIIVHLLLPKKWKVQTHKKNWGKLRQSAFFFSFKEILIAHKHYLSETLNGRIKLKKNCIVVKKIEFIRKFWKRSFPMKFGARNRDNLFSLKWLPIPKFGQVLILANHSFWFFGIWKY